MDAWARQAQGGDEASLERLILRFERPIRVLGMRMLGPDTAEDLAQETFFRMIQGLPKFRFESRFSTWLFGIAYRTAQGMRRQSARPADRAVDLDSAPEPVAPGDPAEAQALRAAVEWALARIRPQHRDAVALHYLKELSLAEVAGVMGVPESTAKVYLFRGRQELYRLLDKEGARPS
ncbi:MAG: RNA polymerase sigma factor [Candidatus Eisenbacteria bacterium]|nr:RNA polymerase sigma factor [Candidatus Eisenbacteria bacterium]